MRVQMETEEDYDTLREQSHSSKWHLLNAQINQFHTLKTH